jgi:GNAT superfamily N-acetyltransferase
MVEQLNVRSATGSDLDRITDLWLRARRRAVSTIPAPVHTDDEVRQWFADVGIPQRDVLVAVDPDGSLVGMLILDDGWVDQLYVDPDRTGLGIGTRLLSLAKERSPEGLELWTFASNHRTRHFYQRHGFVMAEETDGAGNEEGAPDIRYSWAPG